MSALAEQECQILAKKRGSGNRTYLADFKSKVDLVKVRRTAQNLENGLKRILISIGAHTQTSVRHIRPRLKATPSRYSH